MNRLITFLMLLAFVACNNVRDNGGIATISGKWTRSAHEKIYLYKLVNGSLTEIASSSIYEDSTFYFANKPAAEGDFYYIGPGAMFSNRYAFYLKAGDNLDFTVTEDSYVLNGNSSPENLEMAKWHDFVQPLEWKAVYFDKINSTYVDFFPLLEEKLKELESYPKSATGNQAFNKVFEEYRKYNMLDIALHFIYTPRTAHPEGEDFPAYYRMNITDLTQTTAMMKYSPAGIDNLERIIFNNLRLANQKMTNPIDAVMENIPQIANDTLKGELVMRFAKTRRTLAGFLDYRDKYGKYLATENQQNRMREMESALNDAKDGSPAMDFKFADKDGKQVALSDFRGKLVYIDIWATWCGPCKQELPHLKKLEQEYHSNKNIVFLSVSTDASKDSQKWKDYLVKEDLKGVQLFAGDDARDGIIRPYKVSGIPRFVLVGKDGIIISSDAPRPSSSEIRPLLKAHL
jgi:thiol-disulfide isomerase/thioredoxin